MKFTNGYWLIREGVQANYAVHAYEAAAGAEGKRLTVYAPTRRVVDRGGVTDSSMLTVEYSSPIKDVIRVRLIHFAGERKRLPDFELEGCLSSVGTAEVRGGSTADLVLAGNDTEARAAAERGMAGSFASFTSGSLSVRIPLDSAAWRVEFLAEGKVLTSCGSKSSGFSTVEGDGPYIHEMLGIKPGEYVYGLGEHFGPFVKNGQYLDMWNADGGTSSEQAYKNVPFYMTNKGYGVFVNHPGKVSFEVGSEKLSRVQFSVAGESLEYFVIYGPTPAEILKKYCALTGKPALPPAWSFGLWLTTSFTTSYDEATVTSFIEGMAERELPLSVFHFDCFWMREYNWCDFKWDERTFPDPEGMLKRLKAKGLKICAWINPYIAQRSPLFAEGAEKGFLLMKENGDVWQWDRWIAGMGLVDFTNPAARTWYCGKLKTLLDMGVDSFKTDFGERIPTDVVYHDGADPERMHNYYAYLYNKTVFELLEKEKGVGSAVLFARSASAGSQKFPAHWGGDCESNFESMAESLRGGLSLSLSGFGFWSHDIGGFEGKPRAEVYKRWIAFGLLSPLSRLHGSSSYRVPWLFDEEAVDVLRFFTRLKNSLMPYLYGAAVAASRDALPMMRPMMFEFPDDAACAYLDRQYLLGPSLLVAPVFSESGEAEYYVPEGTWTKFLTGEVVEGPRWIKESHDFMSLPLLVRPGSLLPRGTEEGRPDYDYAQDIRLEAYALADGAGSEAYIPRLTGDRAARFAAVRSGRKVEVSLEGTVESWSLLLVGVKSCRVLEGGEAREDGRGVLIGTAPGTRRVTLELL